MTYPRYRPSAPSETLAHRFRPLMWFDEGEHWNPLDVGNFFAEGQHRICDSATACVTATSVRDLRTHTSADAWIDIAGSGDASVFRSPNSNCITGIPPDEILDCGSGSSAAAYWHLSAPSPRGYKYLDYWFFYRYNDHVEGFDHEGDWESISVAPSPSNTTFDFASFSGHGHWYSYLRDNLACDGRTAGSCGTEASKAGQRVSSFVAAGGHSNYGQPCTGICGQATQTRPETQHGGEREWEANYDTSALAPLPPTAAAGQLWTAGPREWVDWPGSWSADGEISAPATPPNKAHFDAPWVNECADESLCPAEGALASTNSVARASSVSECGTWFGPEVVALACNPRRLGASVRTRQLGRRGRFSISVAGRRRRQASAPGISQFVGKPLKPGAKIYVRGRGARSTALYIRIRVSRKRVYEAKFNELALSRRARRATVRVRRLPRAGRARLSAPSITLERADGADVRPNRLRRIRSR